MNTYQIVGLLTGLRYSLPVKAEKRKKKRIKIIKHCKLTIN